MKLKNSTILILASLPMASVILWFVFTHLAEESYQSMRNQQELMGTNVTDADRIAGSNYTKSVIEAIHNH